MAREFAAVSSATPVWGTKPRSDISPYRAAALTTMATRIGTNDRADQVPQKIAERSADLISRDAGLP